MASPATSVGVRSVQHDSDQRQRELIACVRTLGPAFAERAFRYDREASFPHENFRALREAGLLGLCIPEEYGGLGADFETYCLVAAEIGRYCGSTANTFNMHSCAMLWLGTMIDDFDLDPEQRAQISRARNIHFERVLRHGSIYAQPFSESGENWMAKPFATKAEPVDGGWRITGRKIFASLSGAADYYGVVCTETAADGQARWENTLYLAVPKDSRGLSVSGDWDPLGMRGTVSRTLVLDDVFVSAENALMPRGTYFQGMTVWPHMFMTLCPTYMGVAQAAYDFTVQYLRGEVPGMPPIKRRAYATKQLAVAEMYIKLQQARALFERTIAEAGPNPEPSRVMNMFSCQYVVMETANEIARLAIRTCGGQSMLKQLPLERLYRDSRCGSLMLPFTAEICQMRLGNMSLYLPGETDDAVPAAG